MHVLANGGATRSSCEYVQVPPPTPCSCFEAGKAAAAADLSATVCRLFVRFVQSDEAGEKAPIGGPGAAPPTGEDGAKVQQRSRQTHRGLGRRRGRPGGEGPDVAEGLHHLARRPREAHEAE